MRARSFRHHLLHPIQRPSQLQLHGHGDWQKLDWIRGKMFVITNGTRFEEFISEKSVRVVSGQFASMESYPGLLVFNQPKGDITLSYSGRLRTFTPHWQMSTVYLLTGRSDPYVRAITHGASFGNGGLAPGSIATLFGEGLSRNDPANSASVPLPLQFSGATSTNDQGKTEVAFVQNGIRYSAPFFYGSARQLNIQVPWELVAGAATTVEVVLNGVASNKLAVNIVPFNSAIFVVDWSDASGAVVFQDGGLVSPSRPAKAGDIISAYATGLGAVSPPPPATGKPAPYGTLYNVTNQVTATIGGINAPVLFAGLVPGFVGLYQINLQVPEGVPAGKNPLVLSVGTAASPAVNIYVAGQ